MDNNRIKKILMKNRESFYNRIFTQGEKDYILQKNHDYKTVAGLFSAKESISKAIGTGIGKISWKDIEIYHDINGKPKVKFNPLNEYLKVIKYIDISISHEKDYGISFALVNWGEELDLRLPEDIMSNYSSCRI